jgi:uncharacterized protein (TIGR03067 family)
MHANFALAFIAALFFVPIEEQPSAKQELAKLKGTWQVTGLDDGEDQAPADELAKIQLAIDDDKITFTGAAEKLVATFKIDPGKTPKEIDMVPLDGPKKGKVYKGYYSLDGDTLKLCFSEKLDERPKAMKVDAASKTGIMTLKRAAKK